MLCLFLPLVLLHHCLHHVRLMKNCLIAVVGDVVIVGENALLHAPTTVQVSAVYLVSLLVD